MAGEQWSADGECLADVSPMGMDRHGHQSRRWNEGSSTRSRSTMTSPGSPSQRGRSNLEETHRAECPKQTKSPNYSISYVCLLKDQHSCRLYLGPSSRFSCSLVFGSQAVQGASRKRLHVCGLVRSLCRLNFTTESRKVLRASARSLPIGVGSFVTADDHSFGYNRMIEGSKICP